MPSHETQQKSHEMRRHLIKFGVECARSPQESVPSVICCSGHPKPQYVEVKLKLRIIYGI